MRILYVSFIKPSEKFGGGLVILQTLSTLCKIAEIDYIGLDFDYKDFKKYRINPVNNFVVKPSVSKINRIINFIIRGVTSSYYQDWKKISKGIDFHRYDYVYMDFTRHSFVADWAYKNNIPLVIRAHNVEADYANAMYKNNKTIKHWIQKVVAKKNEKRCVKKSAQVITLTNYEKDRFQKLYDEPENKFSIIPVCVKKFNDVDQLKNHKPYILITGSLWFGPNADGALWFLEKVWPDLEREYGNRIDLIIAGANPNQEIFKLADKMKNIKIFENPKEIGIFYKGAYIYVAPIFYGAGMKVKIAEALSCGLHVVTTSHAVLGYEASKKYIYVADDAKTFKTAIRKLLQKDKLTIEKERKEIVQIFEDQYSMEKSVLLLKGIFENLNEVYR